MLIPVLSFSYTVECFHPVPLLPSLAHDCAKHQCSHDHDRTVMLRKSPFMGKGIIFNFVVIHWELCLYIVNEPDCVWILIIVEFPASQKWCPISA